jgi:hypothetical protein
VPDWAVISRHRHPAVAETANDPESGDGDQAPLGEGGGKTLHIL